LNVNSCAVMNWLWIRAETWPQRDSITS